MYMYDAIYVHKHRYVYRVYLGDNRLASGPDGIERVGAFVKFNPYVL